MSTATHPRRLARLKQALNRKLDEQALEAQPAPKKNSRAAEPEEQRQKRLAAEIAVLESRVDRNGRAS